MGRSARLPAICVMVLLPCVVLMLFANCSAGKTTPSPAFAAGDLGRGLVKLTGAIQQAIKTVLPGIAIGAGGVMLYTNRGQLQRKTLYAGCVGLTMAALCFVPFEPMGGAAGGEAAGGGQNMPVGPTHSGEEMMQKDGSFARVADHRVPVGTPPQQGWQQSLMSEVTEAIKGGKEQVVLTFSRQGCPWCDRQVPVIQRAIQRRASAAAGAVPAAGAAMGAFVLPPASVPTLPPAGAGGGSMLVSPLRVFVLDAQDFSYLMQQFQVEAFPTTMVFGPPGVTPLMARGYLEDDDFDQMLKAAATGMVPGEQGAQKKKRGLFR